MRVQKILIENNRIYIYIYIVNILGEACIRKSHGPIHVELYCIATSAHAIMKDKF